MNRLSRFLSTLIVAAGALTLPASAQVVGEVGVDWIGNDIIIEAVPDPQIKGVTCHVTYFERGIIDRLKNGNWFEDPSNNSISCRQTGPIEIDKINLGKGGEEVFRQGRSLIWKDLLVTRIYDKTNDTLIYLAHSRQVVDGSAKMAISTIPLYGQEVTWKNGKP